MYSEQNIRFISKYAFKILDALPDGLIILNRKQEVVFVNQNARNLLKKDQQEFFHKKFFITDLPFFTLKGNVIPKNSKIIKAIKQGLELKKIELTIKNPEKKYVSINITPFRSNGRASDLLLLTLRDITDLKIHQRDTNRFIKIIGHELKHPLTSIKAYLYFLKKAINSNSNEQAQEQMKSIDQQVNLINSMLNDLLDISKISVKNFQISLEETDLAKLLSSFVAKTQPLYPNHQLVTEIDGPIFCRVDSIRFWQVITNLVSNAVKYSDKGSKVTLKLKSNRSFAELLVIDQGAGISKKNLAFIFDPYFRTPNNSQKGLGLGLYLAQEVIKQHYGTITVKSQPNKGSVFTITLPLSK